MAYSTQRAVSDGTMTYLDVSIGFQYQSDISVFYDDLPADDGTWAWSSTTSKRIVFTTAIADGVEVLIKRATTMSKVINVFANGAKFNNASMDTNFQQMLYLTQEAVEGAALTDIFNNVDFHGYLLKNLGDAVDDSDAISYGQLKTMSTGAYSAQLAAQAAQAAAEAARDLAAKWATQATTTVDGTYYSARQYAINASTSATNSAASATTATNAATTATAQAGIATTGGSTATTQAAAAAASATAASGSASAAAASAQAAADSAASVALPIPIGSGGTGQTTASAARTALDVPSLSGTNTFPLQQTFTVRPIFNEQTPYDTGNLNTAAARTSLLQGRKLIAEVVLSSAATALGHPTCFIDSECDVFELEFVDVKLNQTTAGTNATANVTLQTTRDSGSTWDATTTINNQQWYSVVGATSVTVSGAASEASIRGASFGRSNTNYPLVATYVLYRVNVATPLQAFSGEVHNTSNTLATQFVKCTGNLADGNVKTGIRMLISSLSNCTGMTGTLRIYGHRKVA